MCYPNYAQTSNKLSNNLSMGSLYKRGYNLPEYELFNYFTNEYINSFEINFSKQTSGKNYWEQLFNYPEIGISLYHSSLGNNEIYGKEWAAIYYFKIHFIKHKHFSVYNRTGIGLSYVNEKYDEFKNPYNTAIGSNFNIHFNFQIGTEISITPKLAFDTGISFDHISNSNTFEPNLGINYLTAYSGLNYKIGKTTSKTVHEIPKHKSKSNLTYLINFGGKHTRALSSDYYTTISNTIEYKYNLLRWLHLGIGTDLFYDGSIKKQLTDAKREFKQKYHFQSGIYLTTLFRYNNIFLGIQQGTYVLLPEKVNGYKYYNRALVQYYINKHINIRISMKSHLHILDYPEIGIGFSF